MWNVPLRLPAILSDSPRRDVSDEVFVLTTNDDPPSRGGLDPPGRVGRRALERVCDLRRLRHFPRPEARPRGTRRPPPACPRLRFGFKRDADARSSGPGPLALFRSDLFGQADRPGRPRATGDVPLRALVRHDPGALLCESR